MISTYDKSHSEAYQDMFVMTVLNGKRDGVFVEIGCGNAVNFNNTFLLESQFNWDGLSIDLDISHKESFDNTRRTKFFNADALNINYAELFEIYKFPKQIDYLQIDIDPPPTLALKVLKKLPLNQYRFSVITFEHNRYLGGECIGIRNMSRELLKQYGYELVVGDVTNASTEDAFEDWWVDPTVIDASKFDHFDSFNNTGKKYLKC